MVGGPEDEKTSKKVVRIEELRKAREEREAARQRVVRKGIELESGLSSVMPESTLGSFADDIIKRVEKNYPPATFGMSGVQDYTLAEVAIELSNAIFIGEVRADILYPLSKKYRELKPFP